MSDIPITVVNEHVDAADTPQLQNESIYSIQVGYKLFRLSGLSLSSDSPSYFSKWFSDHGNEQTLFLDRDPKLFEHIYNHLQGYHVAIDNAYQMMNLWSDAFYYGLTRLQRWLTEQDLYCVVGNTSFRIPREILGPGNHPNYFSLQYDQLFEDHLSIVERRKLLRPAPQIPPRSAARSPVLFADLLECLRGNFLVVDSDAKREQLLKECRYYRFLELEQNLIKHRIMDDPFEPHQQIIMSLRDLQSRGVVYGEPNMDTETAVMYRRPYLFREPARTLLMQINSDENHVRLVINRQVPMVTLVLTEKIARKYAQVFKERVGDLLVEEDGKKKIVFPVGLSNSKCTVNGMEMREGWAQSFLDDREDHRAKKPKVDGDVMCINVTRSLWRVMMRGNHTRLHAVVLEGCSQQSSFIATSVDFL
ncbi:hypothetical protein DICA1_E29184 [Diutina catenulata]